MRYRQIAAGLLTALAAAIGVVAPSRAATLHSQAATALALAEQRMSATATTLAPTSYPYYVDRSTGAWVTTDSSAWTSGFFPGSLWLLYQATHHKVFAAEAKTWQAGIEGQDTNTSTQDLSFMLYSSFGNGYRLTKNRAYRKVLLTAAASLATRYSSTVGAVRAWKARDSSPFIVIVDGLMDMQLLLWAGKHGGGPSYTTMALNDGLTVARDFVRADGSTTHQINYDPDTGAIDKELDPGGPGTTWARGQAWAIYGFTMIYSYTHDLRMLAAAQQVANYWDANVPADGVPYWEFDPPDVTTAPLDSSAAAVAAAGLLQLAGFTTDPTLKSTYQSVSDTTLKTLTSPSFLSSGTNSAALLLHGTQCAPCDEDAATADTGLSWGDYYLLQALLRWDPNLAPAQTARSRH